MATQAEKLAKSLEVLKELRDGGRCAIRSRDLTRTHRERLLAAGFLQEVMKGWYIPLRSDQPGGDSTAWYVSYWGFCADYLNARFGESWCLSPEQSLLLLAGNNTIPKQLLVRSSKGDNNSVSLPHETSLFTVRISIPESAGPCGSMAQTRGRPTTTIMITGGCLTAAMGSSWKPLDSPM